MFTRLVSKHGLNLQVIEKWQVLLDAKYAEPTRHYHNMFHMSLLTDLYESFV